MSETSSFYSKAKATEEIAQRFADLRPPLSAKAAVAEALRCLYCFDAPCMGACPTHIDVPRFIKKIASGNLEGSARTILEANILGASCSRACPVQVLCEGACVMHYQNQKPIEIGRLQRFAMDALYASGDLHPFSPCDLSGRETGKGVALIGAGPASLACAAELRRRGVRAVVFDARPLPGGLNTYGIAEYKLPLAESLREIDLLTQLGVEFHFETSVDAAMLAELEVDYDAIFLGVGLAGIKKLGVAGEELEGVVSALDFIAAYKCGDLLRVPERVAVIGAGNTATDAAIAAVRLGAREVHVVYRRGSEQMSAFAFEYEHARQMGVSFLWYRMPARIIGEGKVEALELVEVREREDGSLSPATGQSVLLEVGLVVKAIGQGTHAEFVQEMQGGKPAKVRMEKGRILVNRETGQTSNPKYFAGGDCTNGGREVVDAVADGKRAGVGMATWLGGHDGDA